MQAKTALVGHLKVPPAVKEKNLLKSSQASTPDSTSSLLDPKAILTSTTNDRFNSQPELDGVLGFGAPKTPKPHALIFEFDVFLLD